MAASSVVALTLICRSSYRGVVEFIRDLLGVPISVGTASWLNAVEGFSTRR
jgi:hypothetical protein